MNPLRSLSTAAMVALMLTSLAAPRAHAVTIDMVTVGNAGNAADSATGGLYGAVGYEYKIGKYEVTIDQYAEFLDAAAKSDPYGLWDSRMGSDSNVAGISRSGTSGDFSYDVIAPAGQTPAGADSPGSRPIGYVNWFNAARFANWMTNGRGVGSTETGAYTISTGHVSAASRSDGVNTFTLSAPATLVVGDQAAVTGFDEAEFNVRGVVTGVSGSQFTMATETLGDAVATGTGIMSAASANAASNAAFRIPSENEWYKAAYYSPLLNSGSGGYHVFATQSDTPPTSATPSNGVGIDTSPNQANYQGGLPAGQNIFTNVGAFTNSASFYGTFDQNGNVWEWSETIWGVSAGSIGSSRGLRGGGWGSSDTSISSSQRNRHNPLITDNGIGFRLASPVPVPEPSTWVMGAAGIAWAGWGAWRRRKRS